MASPLLEVRGLGVRLVTAGGAVPAVRDLSLGVAPGEVLGLVGESGSGKSMTALSIMRLLPPQATVQGEILYQGRDLLRLPEEEMRQVRGAGITMVFQEPMTALNPVMRVGDQVAEAVLAHGSRGHGASSGSSTPTSTSRTSGTVRVWGPGLWMARRFSRSAKQQAWGRALEALGQVAIPDHEHRARDYPHQLSGGMRQRVMIAMAIVNRPRLLIADEPTTALDVTIQAQILDLLSQLRQQLGLAMIFISHDLGVVSGIADRVAVMYAGSLVEVGSARQVFAQAAHPYTRGLLEAAPTLRSERGRPLKTLEGTVPEMAALPPGCAFEPRCQHRVDDCRLALPALVEVAPGHWARCPVVNRAS